MAVTPPDWRIIAGRSDGGSGVGVPFREIPYGVIDGSNRTFRLSYTPLYGYVWIQLNGVLQDPFSSAAGTGAEFTLAGNIITYQVAPQPDDLHWVWYFRGGPAAAPRTPGRARYFAGPLSGDHLDWGTSILPITGDLSIGMWIKLESASTGWLISNSARFFEWPYSLFVSGSSGAWNITYRHTNSGDIDIAFPAALLNDKWYYIGISRDASLKTVTMYRGDESGNFSTVGTGTYGTNPASGGAFSPPHLYIGNAVTGDGNDHYLDGTVEEHYIWQRAIGAGEHSQAMVGSPPATDLVLACQMGDSPEIDTSGSGFSGTVTGTTLVTGHS